MGVDDSLVNGEFEKLAQAFAGATTISPSLPLTTLVVKNYRAISNVALANAPLHLLKIPK